MLEFSVEKCIDICGLREYAEAAVGSLNVEYKKRTTIAVELAAKVCFILHPSLSLVTN
jgi:ATP-binding cassette subfamily G (WHITE) protein 2 (SNQ2)